MATKKPLSAAAELAKMRWAGTTIEQRRAALAKIQAQRDMSPAARKAIGKRLTEGRKAQRERKVKK